jgi:hypothetical protein
MDGSMGLQRRVLTSGCGGGLPIQQAYGQNKNMQLAACLQGQDLTSSCGGSLSTTMQSKTKHTPGSSMTPLCSHQ